MVKHAEREAPSCDCSSFECSFKRPSYRVWVSGHVGGQDCLTVLLFSRRRRARVRPGCAEPPSPFHKCPLPPLAWRRKWPISKARSPALICFTRSRFAKAARPSLPLHLAAQASIGSPISSRARSRLSRCCSVPRLSAVRSIALTHGSAVLRLPSFPGTRSKALPV